MGNPRQDDDVKLRRRATFRPTAPRRRRKRKPEELRMDEKWICPHGCGKFYRKSSTKSIQNHLSSCPLSPEKQLQKARQQYSSLSRKRKLVIDPPARALNTFRSQMQSSLSDRRKILPISQKDSHLRTQVALSSILCSHEKRTAAPQWIEISTPKRIRLYAGESPKSCASGDSTDSWNSLDTPLNRRKLLLQHQIFFSGCPKIRTIRPIAHSGSKIRASWNGSQITHRATYGVPKNWKYSQRCY